MTSDNPSRAIKCPSCGGSEVFSSDNESLWYPRGISGDGTDEKLPNSTIVKSIFSFSVPI